MSIRHWLISALIVAVLGMQASTFVTGTKIWPFMAYAMYADAKRSVTRFEVIAELDNGTTVPVDEQMMGIRYFAWRDHYVYAFQRGGRDPVPRVVRRVEAHTGLKLRRLQMHTVDHQIVDGAIVAESRTLTLFPDGALP